MHVTVSVYKKYANQCLLIQYISVWLQRGIIGYRLLQIQRHYIDPLESPFLLNPFLPAYSQTNKHFLNIFEFADIQYTGMHI